jgi:hypothetical protein
MTGDREERNRVLGFPVDRHPNVRPASKPGDPQRAARAERRPQDAEPQRAARAERRPQDAEPQRAARAERRPQDAEPQRVLGLPVDWLDGFTDQVMGMLRRIRGSGGLKQRK